LRATAHRAGTSRLSWRQRRHDDLTLRKDQLPATIGQHSAKPQARAKPRDFTPGPQPGARSSDRRGSPMRQEAGDFSGAAPAPRCLCAAPRFRLRPGRPGPARRACFVEYREPSRSRAGAGVRCPGWAEIVHLSPDNFQITTHIRFSGTRRNIRLKVRCRNGRTDYGRDYRVTRRLFSDPWWNFNSISGNTSRFNLLLKQNNRI